MEGGPVSTHSFRFPWKPRLDATKGCPLGVEARPAPRHAARGPLVISWGFLTYSASKTSASRSASTSERLSRARAQKAGDDRVRRPRPRRELGLKQGRQKEPEEGSENARSSPCSPSPVTHSPASNSVGQLRPGPETRSAKSATRSARRHSSAMLPGSRLMPLSVMFNSSDPSPMTTKTRPGPSLRRNQRGATSSLG